ncbi:hypothetical protein SIN8267_00157 [Sinobacterium norvegicum]|uniref:Lipoprotein n=1 Tax=Sinobacterium norvegicum TaxID=1641715 RepID=A0ABM9AAU2_9GAMM|nr:hypothetical protein [Sinobacterium norvegicum]CAH0990074.1 hypothetical protein SIN8267_00157 [Sinobacterium norvegicum]
MRKLATVAISASLMTLLAACSSQPAADDEQELTLDVIVQAGRDAADTIIENNSVETKTDEYLDLEGTQNSMIELGLVHASDNVALARDNADMVCRYELDHRRGIELGLIDHAGATYYGQCAELVAQSIKEQPAEQQPQ